MKPVHLVALALLSTAAACEQVVTAPKMSDVPTINALVSNPPPPPIDSGAAAVGNASIVFAVTYFFNPVGNSGYLMFDNNQEGSTEVDKNAQVRLHNGTFSGKGTLATDVNGDGAGGLLVVNLASVVTSLSSFAGCAQEVPTETTAAPDGEPRDEAGCFSLTFSDATLDGETIPFELQPSCREGDPRRQCVRTGDESTT